MNIAEKMHEMSSGLLKKFDEFIVYLEKECEDEWDEKYAIVLVTLDDEEYLDYDQLKSDIFNEVKVYFPKFKVLNKKQKDPKAGSFLRFWPIGCGLSFEIEAYQK